MTWLIQIEACPIVSIVYHKHTIINNCDNTLPCGSALIRLENMLIRRVSSVSSPEPACSPQNWTSVFLNRNSVLLLCLHISKWKFYRAVFIVRTTKANPAFKYSISNWRFSRAAFLNRTDHEPVCLSVEPLELSVRYDSQSESKHANLIDEPLVYYMANRFDSIW